MPTQEISLAAPPADSRDWLIREFGIQIAAAIQVLTGETHRVENAALQAPPAEPCLIWRQSFSDVPGFVWLVARDDSWRGIGASLLRAAGIEETADQLRSEYLEIIRQTVAAVATAIAEKFGHAVTPGIGEQLDAIGAAEWGKIEMTISGAPAEIAIGVEPELLAALLVDDVPALPSAPASVVRMPEHSKTFELLLDLELPVSISFGRAQVLLKDVLKLTVGSIVELNRAIGDPVEVIVNNCVIARGQVVVVEGNFGVRIQNVISTQERLRSLD